MYYTRSKIVIALIIMLAVAAFAFASIPAAKAGQDNRAPELPSPLCDSVQAPPGHKVAFHVYARGVQVYRWNGSSWDFVGPVAMLFADSEYQGLVGHHFATPNGPAWESNSGSKVIASVQQRCTPDPTAIAWLRLGAVSTTGPGIFSSVTFIQRVNTTGGIAPATPGAINEVAEAPYTTEYYFYREEN